MFLRTALTKALIDDVRDGWNLYASYPFGLDSVAYYGPDNGFSDDDLEYFVSSKRLHELVGELEKHLGRPAEIDEIFGVIKADVELWHSASRFFRYQYDSDGSEMLIRVIGGTRD